MKARVDSRRSALRTAIRIVTRLVPLAVLCSCQALSLGPEFDVPEVPPSASAVPRQVTPRPSAERVTESIAPSDAGGSSVRWISTQVTESTPVEIGPDASQESPFLGGITADDIEVDSDLTAVPPEPSLPKWLADAIDPNCPCLREEDSCGCECGACSGCSDGRPEGIVGPWPPDEYICDGGDQQTQVIVNPEWKVSGLDLEDTVVHFDTQDGRTVVTPSNSVCIYAPRFAAVRKVVQTSEAGVLLTMREMQLPLPPVVDRADEGPNLVDQPLPLARSETLRAPLALRHRTRGLDLVRLQPVHELVQVFDVFEDLQIIRLGIHRRSEQALLMESVQAAITWTDNLAPEVILDDQAAEVEVAVQRPEAVYSVDQGPPRLRLIKVASCCSALPGEEITFTLRFDNIGDQTISKVTLLDSLTRRLEYVPDSAECSLPAEFASDENSGESLVLRWQLNQPLKPGEGGIIRFRCRVR